MNIWMVNHYATPPSLGAGLRHYNFAKYLTQWGHTVTTFAASAIHNSDINLIDDKRLYLRHELDGQDYVHIRTRGYKGNGKDRVLGMLEFARRFEKASYEFAKPDVVYASSVHIFTLWAALKIAKRLDVPCVCEVRDLWPESIAVYMNKSRKSPVMRALYAMEHSIYRRADRLIFTMAGGGDYINEHGWTDVDLAKIHHINNGVDLPAFDGNVCTHTLDDDELQAPGTFRVVYTGSIRHVNNLGLVVDTAQLLRGHDDIKLLIYGDGGDRERLENERQRRALTNIVFKGRIIKEQVPFVLTRAHVNLLHWQQTELMRYGMSANKLFDYLAAGKPIISDVVCGHDILKESRTGLVCEQVPQALADAIITLRDMPQEERRMMGERAHAFAQDYDFSVLSAHLLEVFESVIDEKHR